MKKKLALFFESFCEIHFAKDPFLVPYYLGKIMEYDVTILYPKLENNGNLPDTYRGVRLIPFNINENPNPTIKYKDIIQYVYVNAKTIDVLMLFYSNEKCIPFVNRYKKGNPTGKVYIKLDINPYFTKWWSSIPAWKKPFSWIKQSLKWKSYIKKLDVVSCEMTKAYNLLSTDCMPIYDFRGKLVLVPNGLDEEEINSLGFGKSQYDKKDNLIITVSRLGSPQKNTDMLLKALKKVDMKDWKFFMVGGVDESFLPKVKQFRKEHPEMENKILWMGPITDRKKLYNIYNQAKVFVLSSKYEGCAIVFGEAKRFSNYLISTKVGASEDIIEGGKYGELVDINDIDAMAQSIQNIVDGKTNINVFSDLDIEKLSWEHSLQPVVEKLI